MSPIAAARARGYGRRMIFASILRFALLGFLAAAPAAADDAGTAITDGRVVTIEYSVTDESGALIDSSDDGKKPIVYTQGGGGVFPALQKALVGLEPGAEKTVRLSPKDAFGEHDPTALVEVPKEKIPADGLEVGALLAGEAPDGKKLPVRIHEIKESVVVLDTNHPLAGKTLVFHVKVAKVEEAAPAAP
jgi:peptidylprolyl isomerase